MSLLSPSTWTARYLHSTFAVVAALPLLSTLLTGFAYRFSRGVLQSDKADVSWLMDLHTMSTVSLHTVYPLLVALATLFMAATGIPLSSLGKAWQRLRAGRAGVWVALVSLPTKFNVRALHRISTSLLLLPLSLTAVTGAVWTVQQHYLGYAREQSSWLLHLHQGNWLASGSRGPVMYTALLFLLTLPALLSGLTLLPLWTVWGSAGAAGGERGVGGVRAGGGVRYTMLSVKQAFEGEEDEHDSDAAGTGMMDEDEQQQQRDGRAMAGGELDSEDDEDGQSHSNGTALNGR